MITDEDLEWLARTEGKILPIAFDSLEELLTSRQGFGLTTATPLQRAICRVVDGQPLKKLADHPHVIKAIGDVSHLDGVRPKRILLIAGIRTFKSMLAAAAAVWASQNCDVSRLGPGEIPRFSIVSLKKDLAQVMFGHITGQIEAKGLLQSLIDADPTKDTVVLRHPSGKPVEISVVAGSRAGSSLVARWSAGVAFDEAPRMIGQEDGVVNLDDLRSAVAGRLLPGAQMFEIGSPWQPYGPIYEDVIKYHGKPSADLVVIRARADWLNPVAWTPEACEDLKRQDPPAYQTDVLAEFVDREESLFPQQVLDECTREQDGPLMFNPAYEYAAAMDPATRSNAWTLIIGTREGNIKKVALAHDWQGSPVDPLRPRKVLKEIAEWLREYDLDWCYTDQWAAEALQDLADLEGITLVVEDWTAKNKSKAFLGLAAEAAEGNIEIPPHPTLRKDLTVVKKKATNNGVSIVLPRTPDGRHADYAPAAARCFARWIDDVSDPVPAIGTPQRQDYEAEQRMLRAAQAVADSQNREWWDQG